MQTRTVTALTFGLLISLTTMTSMTGCAPASKTPEALPDPTQYQINPQDLSAELPDLGRIGLWMVTKKLENATWLGSKYKGRTLREPINVILLDKVAQNETEAVTRMMTAMNKAGYGPKNMHSDGYYGYIGSRLYAQYPQSGKGLAFSDGPWYTTNHHGRLFGPAKVAGGYVFTGAFSLEDFVWLPKPGHPYNSFQATRENLADKLTEKTNFKRAGYIDLKSVIDTPTETTADHDGKAVVLIADQ